MQISGFEAIGQNSPLEGRNDITGHLDEALSWVKGKHEFRFGGEYRQAEIDEFYQRHSVGSFKFTGVTGPWAADYEDASGQPLCTGYFASTPALLAACQSGSLGNVLSLADFLAGDLASGTIARGDAERQVFMKTFDLFAQDSWQFKPNLSLDYGVRYDYLQPMRSDYQNLSVFRPELISSDGLAFQGNQIGSVYPSDWANVSPRVGFSYSPKSAKGVVVRGGFGIFFDTPNANPFLDNRPGNNAPNGLEGNPRRAKPGLHAFSIWEGHRARPFHLSRGHANHNQPVPSRQSVRRLLCRPEFQDSVQLQLQPATRAGHWFQSNHSDRVCRQRGTPTAQSPEHQPALHPGGPTTSVLYQSTTWAGVTERPYLSQYPQYGDINQIETIGTSNYNSLQSVLKIRSYHGLTSQFSYTWGHNLDEVTTYRGQLPQDSTHFKGDYGNSDFDTRNTFVAYANYDVPGFRGPKFITNGWQLNSVITLKGGQPVNLVTSTDTTGENEYTQRPNIIGHPFAGITTTFRAGLFSGSTRPHLPTRHLEPTVTTLVTASTGRALKTSISLSSRTLPLRSVSTPNSGWRCSICSII